MAATTREDYFNVKFKKLPVIHKKFIWFIISLMLQKEVPF